MIEIDYLLARAKQADAIGDLRSLDVIIAKLSQHQYNFSPEQKKVYDNLQVETKLWK